MNSDDEDDAQDDGHHGGGQVVGDGSPPDSAREGHVQRPHGCYEGRDDQREDESFQHPEEDLANVGDVHHLPVSPLLLALPQHQAEYDAAKDPGHCSQGQSTSSQKATEGLHFITNLIDSSFHRESRLAEISSILKAFRKN